MTRNDEGRLSFFERKILRRRYGPYVIGDGGGKDTIEN
jgi:hypothetical protein